MTGARGSRVAGSLANRMWQMLVGPPNLQGETLTKDRHLRLRFPLLFNRANIHAGLAHVVLTVMLEPDVALFFGPIRLRLCTIRYADFGEFTFYEVG